MNKLRLDTDTNQLVLTGEGGEETRYRPLAGSAKDLYDSLKDMARTNPDQVVGTLEGAAHLVASESGPASTSATVSGNIPWTASRSSNPDSKRDAKVTNQPKKRDYSKGGTFAEAQWTGNAAKLIAKAQELAKGDAQPMIWADKGRGYVQLVTSAKPELELPLSPAEAKQVDAYVSGPDGFAEDAGALAPAVAPPAPMPPPLPEQDYASWEASLGDDVAQINRQRVGDTEVVTARNSTGAVISTFTGTEQAGIVAASQESSDPVGPLDDAAIDRLAAEAIDFLTSNEALTQ